jgi:uncharacterized protein YjbJ (UPF0337 family)
MKMPTEPNATPGVANIAIPAPSPVSVVETPATGATANVVPAAVSVPGTKVATIPRRTSRESVNRLFTKKPSRVYVDTDLPAANSSDIHALPTELLSDPPSTTAAAASKPWRQHIASARIIWGKLTERELLESQGHEQRLIGLLKDRYSMTGDAAEDQVKSFLAKHRT